MNESAARFACGLRAVPEPVANEIKRESLNCLRQIDERASICDLADALPLQSTYPV